MGTSSEVIVVQLADSDERLCGAEHRIPVASIQAHYPSCILAGMLEDGITQSMAKDSEGHLMLKVRSNWNYTSTPRNYVPPCTQLLKCMCLLLRRKDRSQTKDNCIVFLST